MTWTRSLPFSGTDPVSELDARFKAVLREIDQRFASADKALKAALTSTEKAIVVAQAANEKRLDSVNEFRQQQADIIARFILRSEYVITQGALSDKVNDLRSQLEAVAGTIVPRNETDAWRTSLVAKLDANNDRMIALELRLTSRLDIDSGDSRGRHRADVETDTKMNQRLLLAGVAISLVVVLANILVSLISHHVL
jgi:hypothetical protein